jgi:hypothetical protein
LIKAVGHTLMKLMKYLHRLIFGGKERGSGNRSFYLITCLSVWPTVCLSSSVSFYILPSSAFRWFFPKWYLILMLLTKHQVSLPIWCQYHNSIVMIRYCVSSKYWFWWFSEKIITDDGKTLILTTNSAKMNLLPL